jgi:plastocyanin
VRRLATLLAALGLAFAAGAPAALAQDTTAPTTTASLDPPSPGPGGIYPGPVAVTLSATDPDVGAEPETIQVAAQGFSWDTTLVEATAGDTVEWDFSGGGHDICIDDSPPEWSENFGDCGDDEVLGDFREGDTGGSKTFAAPGSFGFYCSLHEPSMRGTVEVAEGGEPGSGVEISQYRVITDGTPGELVESSNGSSADPFETTFNVSEPGEHVVEYFSTDVAGNVEVTKDVEFEIDPAGGAPDVALTVKPRTKRAKVNRPVSLTARLANSGGPATEVEVCVKAKSRLVKVTGGRCWWLDELAGGAARASKFTFKPKRAARGKRVRVQFKTTHAGGPTETTTATLKVARR